MKVILRRNLYLGDILYKPHPSGTEIPDEIDGKKVVLPKEYPHKEPDTIELPLDALIWNEENSKKAPPPRLQMVKPEPTVLRDAGPLIHGHFPDGQSFSKDDTKTGPFTGDARGVAGEKLDSPRQPSGLVQPGIEVGMGKKK